MSNVVILHFLSLLKNILKAPDKKMLIKKFQDEIWEHAQSNDVYERLSELAYDLDFYEPVPDLRKEDSSFFGDEQLKNEIEETMLFLSSALKK
ncbi:hypothetical protein SCG7109_AE_00160 [Chlamydiales bacterium SCGC AG-110-M15]|nr:hypothetical protein SCG7109_AE_00160 [Chlamydiales bacterium SCGC AG-110-M15]